MTTTDRVERDETTDDLGTPAARRARRRWPWLLGAGVVVLVVGTWLVLASTPSFSPSYGYGVDPEAVDEPPGFFFGPDESSVTDPSDGTYDGFWTFQNDGLLPATVRIADTQPDAYEWRAQVFPLSPNGALTDEDVARARDELTVRPGESFGVTYAFGFGCAHVSAGNGTGLDSISLEVTTLGVARTIDVGSNVAISVMAGKTHYPPAGCDD